MLTIENITYLLPEKVVFRVEGNHLYGAPFVEAAVHVCVTGKPPIFVFLYYSDTLDEFHIEYVERAVESLEPLPFTRDEIGVLELKLIHVFGERLKLDGKDAIAQLVAFDS